MFGMATCAKHPGTQKLEARTSRGADYLYCPDCKSEKEAPAKVAAPAVASKRTGKKKAKKTIAKKAAVKTVAAKTVSAPPVKLPKQSIFSRFGMGR
jgi:hypothetical protein